VLVAVVAVQIAVPLIAAFQPPPARLGWQMYSGLGTVPTIVLHATDGTVEVVPSGDYASRSRGEIDWAAYLPTWACDTYPDTVSGWITTPRARTDFEC
jgi:hypothetical protein